MLPKLRVAKKNPPTSFPNRLLKNVWIESTFPYALLLHHKGAKWNTIEVIRRISAKLPHHKGFALTFPMENKTQFVRHIVKQQGCNYTIEDNESLNERNERHPKTKPNFKMM